MDCRKTLNHRAPRLTRYAVGVATCLLNLPVGVPWYYGNLSAYLDSYFISRAGMNADHTSGSLWMVGVFFSSWTLAVILSGAIANKIGPLWLVVVGVAGFNSSVFLTYVMCLNSFWSMHLTLGVGAGFFAGLVYAMTMWYAAVWFPHTLGLATSVAASGFGGGSLILNHLVTVFINPDNKIPDIRLGTGIYFSDKEILSRVPSVFLKLGAISFGSQALGLFLISDPPTSSHTGSVWKTDISSMENREEKNTEETKLTSLVNSQLDGQPHSPVLSESTENSENAKKKATDPSPGEVLKTPSFYLLSLTYLFVKYGLEVEINFYKQFGLKHINDDHFLTTVGTLVNLTVLVFRIVWGLVIDQVEPKVSLVVLLSLHAITTIFWYFTALADRWLYLAWTLLVQAIQCGTMVIYPVMTFTLFGPSNYVTNLGMVIASGVLLGVAAPLCVEVLLHRCGYFWVMFSVSMASACGVCQAVFLPRSNTSQTQRAPRQRDRRRKKEAQVE